MAREIREYSDITGLLMNFTILVQTVCQQLTNTALKCGMHLRSRTGASSALHPSSGREYNDEMHSIRLMT
jgi:hypothetical protein